MKSYASLGLVLLLGSSLAAQSVPPALMVEQDGRSVPLGLSKVQTEVRIFGSVAETTTTMIFTNPMPRVMEGNLYFPLPEGAAISGYALDINGVMVDGVAVEKHEARRVFEEVVRRGIDPGLVEWTKGNNFQTRVFPIPARGSRTIRVQYASELLGGKEAPAYHLPLKFKDKLGEFSLRVEVVKPAAPPKVTKGELANFSFEKWRESYVAETKQQNVAPVEDLVIALPKTDQPQVVVEKADDGQVYFAIHDDPPAPAAQLPVAAAKHVVLFWDASGSRAGDHKREVVVLERFLTRLLPEPAKIRIDLVLVRNTASKPVRIEFSNTEEVGRIGNPSCTRSALAAELEKVQYDGGTQLGAIGPLPGTERPDLYLLCTDGISNFGREEPGQLDAPLVIFAVATSANHAFLHSLAMTNGGRYFNLANWKDADVVDQAGRSAWSFLSASIDEGESGARGSRSHAPRGNARFAALRREDDGTQSVPARVPTQSVGTRSKAKDLYPQQPQPLAGRFTLAGKLNGDAATVTISYGIPGRTSEKRTFKVSRSDAAEGSLLRRLWAQKRLAELMIFQKRNEKEIAALGKQFGMVTPYTSLLVLDTLEQYVQYEIAPPKSLAAMREEYMRRIDTIEHQKQKQKSGKLTAVVRMWEERVKWWNTEFKYPKDFKYMKQRTKAEVGGETRFDDPFSETPMRRTPSREMGRDGRADPKSRPPAARTAPADKKSATVAKPVWSDIGGDKSVAPFETNLRLTVSQTQEVHSERGGQAEGERANSRQPGIAIKEWTPDTPYLKELRAAKGKADLFAVYMKNHAQFGNSPAFFLDCADFFREANQLDLALQVLSNIAELELEDAGLLRVLGYRLLQIGQLDLAVQTFEHVLDLRPEEPQSYRDLALTLARRAEVAAALTPGPSPVQRERAEMRSQTSEVSKNSEVFAAVREDYRRAIDLFVRIVLTHWDERFPEIEVIALEEVNHIIPKAKAAGVSDVPLDPRLIKLLDVDVRIVMSWQADNTDIDLWVTEPSGEKAFYDHNRTTIGGLVSRDFTGGYGPEQYLVRRAAHGMYKIEANYYGSRATRLLGAVTVQADGFTNYGRPNEQRKSLTLRLKEAKETVPIGEIEF